MAFHDVKKWIRSAMPWFCLSAAFTVMAGSGVLETADAALSDAFYQRRGPTDERIIVVGIDDKALRDIGPVQGWPRQVMARAIRYLNQSEELCPAVIGLDVLYGGETKKEEDDALAAAAGEYGNVVTAAAAVFGPSMEMGEGGKLSVKENAILAFEEPYETLRRASAQGHINAMYDRDGVMRHAILKLALPDGRTFPSFALAVAERYQEKAGEGPLRLPATDDHGYWYLDYKGMPGDYYESISVADLLSGEAPADYFAGRIVLIGPYAAGLGDQYITPIDHGAPMYGVEIQANAIHALLEGNFREETGEGVQLAALFVVMCALAYWFRGRKPLPCAAACLALVLGYGALCRAAYEMGTVLHILWIPSGAAMLLMVTVASNYISASMEKRRLTSTFKRYVAPEIVDEILRQGQGAMELGGKLCDITVLFADIRGFTAMSERLKPQQVVEILNRYLSLASSCVKRHGGTLDKFIGDAVMAFWGAPIPRDDGAMEAVLAALDMREGAAALNREMKERYGQEICFGIGIHRGPAVVGNIGAPDRMDYTAIGDTVNTASRLEAIAPGGTIYISRAAAHSLKGRIQVRQPEGQIQLKGKAAGFKYLILEDICRK